MSFRTISALKAARLTRFYDPKESILAQQFHPAISRRRFALSVAGTAALGTTLGSAQDAAETVASRWTFAPVPIPGATPGLGGFYHVFGPNPAPGGDPIDAEPATITNFDGFVGLAYISGNVTQTNTKTGEQQLYPFVDSDMRFMQGIFRGTDGRNHEGAFALV